MTREYCYQRSLEYFRGNELAADVFLKKYALKDGSIFKECNPDDMHRRLAIEFARKLEERGDVLISNNKQGYLEQVYRLFKDFKYIIPQGSIMAMLGNSYQLGSLSNCFVLGKPEDSYGGILLKDQQLVQLMKRRGGVGLDLSSLRPANARVNNAAQTSTGAVSFAERYSNSTREVAQGGRRGALMLTLDIKHPDVQDFIEMKQDTTRITGANISIMLHDDFLRAVENNQEYILRYPCDLQCEPEDYSNLPLNHTRIINKDNKKIVLRKVNARNLWESTIKCAHNTAEPGLIFIDRQWDYSPDGVYPQYRGVTTNPCSEIFMQEYDACRLMCINLYSLVDRPFQKSARVNYKKIYDTAYAQQVLADCLVDLETEHIDRILRKISDDPEFEETKQVEYNLWTRIRKVCLSGRRTGCGITGLGDMIAALNVPYDSDKAKGIVARVMKIKMRGELNATIDMAERHGTFVGCAHGGDDTEYRNVGSSKDNTLSGLIPANPFYAMLLKNFPREVSRMYKHGRRNVSWSTVAPTGSVSILTETTSGLEPLFLPYYMRRKKVNQGDVGVKINFVDQSGDKWQEYPVLHPKISDWLSTRSYGEGECEAFHGWTDAEGGKTPEKRDEIRLLQTMSGDELDCLFRESPWHKSTANEINWNNRVSLQSIIQRYTTHSISSTINLPADVSVAEVGKIYLQSWREGLKGITVYRDGCRTGVLVSTTSIFEANEAPKRKKVLKCDLYHTTAKGVRWTVVVGLFLDKPYEVFAVPGELGNPKQASTLTKVKRGVYSLAQVGSKEIIEDLTCNMTPEEEALTRMISTALRHGADIKFVVEQLNKTRGDLTSFAKGIARIIKFYIPDGSKSSVSCEECSSPNVIFEEGCQRCLDCGTSLCG